MRCAIRRCSRWTSSARRSPDELFSILDDRDVLLHHPYDSYDPVDRAARAGGRGSRRAGDQADALSHELRARRSSRACSGPPSATSRSRCCVELTARFDEERNIQWARALESAGAHVIYGVRGFKTHAKVMSDRPADAARASPLRASRHRQLQRADRAHLHRLRPDDVVAGDRRRTRRAFFNALTGYSDPPRLKKLVMAPTGCAGAS